jgi:hypothetical protein
VHSGQVHLNQARGGSSIFTEAFVGPGGVAPDRHGTEQEDLWNDRGLAQSDEGEHPYLYLDGIVASQPSREKLWNYF